MQISDAEEDLRSINRSDKKCNQKGDKIWSNIKTLDVNIALNLRNYNTVIIILFANGSQQQIIFDANSVSFTSYFMLWRTNNDWCLGSGK